MSFCDRAQHIEKQADPRTKIKPVLVPIAIDLGTLDMFEHKARLSVGRNCGVDLLGDVRWRKHGENASFALEALFPVSAEERNVEKLDGKVALEAPVVAFGEPDVSHAALADLRQQRVD